MIHLPFPTAFEFAHAMLTFVLTLISIHPPIDIFIFHFLQIFYSFLQSYSSSFQEIPSEVDFHPLILF